MEKEEIKDGVTERTARKVIVKTMTVENGVREVFDFFAEGKNMELGGAIKSLSKNEDGWWTFDHNVAGKSKMKLNDVPQYGILDHVFIGGGLEWSVFVRVTPNQTGSTTTWTFLRPDCLDDKQFEEQLQMFNLEMDNWKHALEGKSRLRF